MFLAIHPFQDGNGRLSRVLTTLLLLRGLCLRALQLARKRHQTKQGEVLSLVATNPGDDPHRCAGLEPMDRVFSAFSHSRSNDWSGRWNASASSSVICLSYPLRSSNSRANWPGDSTGSRA
nr:Fic family protein [Brucella intermedia]